MVVFLGKPTPSKKTLFSTWADKSGYCNVSLLLFLLFISPDSLRTEAIKGLCIQNIYWALYWRKIGRDLEEHRKIMSLLSCLIPVEGQGERQTRKKVVNCSEF